MTVPSIDGSNRDEAGKQRLLAGAGGAVVGVSPGLVLSITPASSQHKGKHPPQGQAGDGAAGGMFFNMESCTVFGKMNCSGIDLRRALVSIWMHCVFMQGVPMHGSSILYIYTAIISICYRCGSVCYRSSSFYRCVCKGLTTTPSVVTSEHCLRLVF